MLENGALIIIVIVIHRHEVALIVFIVVVDGITMPRTVVLDADLVSL